MKKFITFLLTVLFVHLVANPQEITPYKFMEYEDLPSCIIPKASIYHVSRQDSRFPDITYYFTQNKLESYPIAILCGGSMDEENVYSIIHFHRYFLKECLDLGLGVVSVEQQGINNNQINVKEFISHYTRTRRLEDHECVMKEFLKRPPEGWNGKFVLIGVSEGGPIVTTLTEKFSDHILATINWSGASAFSFRKDLWDFLKILDYSEVECKHDLPVIDCQGCLDGIESEQAFQKKCNEILRNPTPKKQFLNMTYMYVADAFTYPLPNYLKIKTPYLVVGGEEDPNIKSIDMFVKKAKDAGVDLTYFRVAGMDHYIRDYPEYIDKSFEWLKNQMK